MEPIWLKHYPELVERDIDCSQYDNLYQLFSESVEKYADRPAVSNLGVTLTYKQLSDNVDRFAAFLQQNLGLSKGDKLALMMPNLLQYPIALYAGLKAGLTLVNVNPLYTPRELKHQLNDSGADAILILDNFADTLEAVINEVNVKHILMTSVGDMCSQPKRWIVNFVVKYIKKMVPKHDVPSISFVQALKKGQPNEFKQPNVEHSDMAFLQYTGGTTGVSKGAILTHENLLANILQTEAWMKPFLKEGREVVVTALPLYHIFSLTVNCLLFTKCGGHSLLITNPRDMNDFCKTLNQYPFTCITGVNTLFNGLVNFEDFRQLDFSQLRLAIGGGMAVQKSVSDAWHSLTGIPILEGYGLTETSPVVSMNPLDATEYSGTIGLPIPQTQVDIRDADGNSVALNEAGELWVKGPQVMKGYYHRPEETAKTFDNNGWLATGDMAKMDNRGFLSIVDRKKDMILVSGFNVYPNEIEAIIALHPGVLEVAAIGEPDDVKGEVVKVCIVKKDPALSKDDIVKHCKQELTGYKVPKIVEFYESLPKSNVGKILRKELRKTDEKNN